MSRRTIFLLGGLVAGWALIVVVLGPWLVLGAYAGTSPVPFLNRLISGQSVHPAGHYLDLWRRAAVLATVAGAIVLGAGLLVWQRRAVLAAQLGRVLRARPTLGLAEVVLLGAVLGCLSGLGETVTLGLRFLLRPDPREAPPLDALWMAPLATAALGAATALVLGLAARAWRGLSVRIPIGLLATLAGYALLRTARLGLHPMAAMALATGVGVALARWSAGGEARVRRLVFRAAPALLAGLLVTAATIRGADALAARRSAADHPAVGPEAISVLLLILDTVRASSMGLYGYARNTTPAIDAWATGGTTFDLAIAPAPWTLPSHAAMFTGLPAHALSADFATPLDRRAPTLAEVLRARGYATGGFVANTIYASRATGLDRGFATYRDHQVTLGAILTSARWTRLLTRQVWTALGRRGQVVRKQAPEVNRDFLDWLPADGRPFFAFLNYFDAHDPYETHPPFDRRFTEVPPRFWLLRGWDRTVAPEVLREVTDAYDSAIAYLDHHVGALLAELDRRGVLDRTLVIVASDHGEHLGEHGGITSHANSLYLPLLHVPLAMRLPGRVPEGVRVSVPATLADLPATVLDLLGGAPGTPPMPGRSLARHWREGGGIEEVVATLSANTFAHRLDPVSRGPMRSVVGDSLHYIRNGDGSEELYRFRLDPAEGVNLAADSAWQGRVADLRRMVEGLPGRFSPPTRAGPGWLP